MKVATAPVSETVGSYLDHAGVRHEVEVRSVEAQTWEIVDVPEQGDERLVDRLSGELESRDTAVAVAQDYLTQAPGRAD
jgi:hypothetical protein